MISKREVRNMFFYIQFVTVHSLSLINIKQTKFKTALVCENMTVNVKNALNQTLRLFSLALLLKILNVLHFTFVYKLNVQRYCYRNYDGCFYTSNISNDNMKLVALNDEPTEIYHPTLQLPQAFCRAL